MGVTGFGGLFFRSRDPDALSAWYRTHLGIGAGCNSTGVGDPGEWYWLAQGGPTVFAPFKADTDYFAADKAFMINLRVSGIDTLIAELQAAGIASRPAQNGTTRRRAVSPGSTIPKAMRSSSGNRPARS